jgi:hypothetical protein
MFAHPLVEQVPAKVIAPGLIEWEPAPAADIVSSSILAVCPKRKPVKENKGPDALSISVVFDVPAPTVPPPLFGFPVPVISMPLPLIVIPVVHVHGEPAGGIMIVSPFTAVWVGPLITAFTSERLHEAAVNVPCAWAGELQSAIVRQSDPNQLIPVNTNVDRLQKEFIFIVICYILGLRGKRYQLSHRPVLGQLTSPIVLRKRRKLNHNRPIPQVSSYLDRFIAHTRSRITKRRVATPSNDAPCQTTTEFDPVLARSVFGPV